MRARLSIAVVAIVVAVAGLAQTGPGREVLRGAGLLGEPASYTSLFFANPQQPVLPQLYSQEALLDQSFVIHNSSSAPRQYRWQILAVHDGQSQQVAAGKTTVESGRQETVDQAVLTSCVGGRLQLVIRLVAPRESITSWTTCWPGGRV